MSLTLYWQLDVADEPRRAEPRLNPALPPQISDRRAGGRNRFDYYAQIATAAAHTGFDGLYLPHRSQGDDNRIVAGVIARAAGHLALVPEFPASVGSAVYAAKQAVSFQRATHDRLGWAIAPDEDPDTRAAQADSVAQGDLAERLGEFLTVARGVHGARPYSFKGSHFEVLDGGFDAPLNAVPFPRSTCGARMRRPSPFRPGMPTFTSSRHRRIWPAGSPCWAIWRGRRATRGGRADPAGAGPRIRR
jgi:alkanesulfonate monooxygenase